ncbi:hypothetical protein ACIRG5_42365 [Lentzea sp. NPDC102401]|uniref:terminase small subunit n=1 Tax=Lentzea sp. NPDC102401 TaxID=3364128 RepID=UPI0037F13524
MPADNSMASAVASAVAAVKRRPEDVALVRLIERYAQTIDDAAEIAEQASLIEPDNVSTANQLAALKRRVEHQAVLAELGPKLQAALESLGASPKARAAMQKGGPARGRDDEKADSKRAKLDALIDDAEGARKH